jgi:hypothetical protein
MKKWCLVTAGVLMSFCVVRAQSTDVGNWMIYVGNQRFAGKWNWWNEVQYRNYNLVGDLEQLLVRTGIGRNLTEGNNNLLLGYAFIHSAPYTPGSSVKSVTSEHRIFQQFITRQSFGRVFLQHRYRLEERFLADRFRARFRYFLGANIPFNKPKMEKGAWYLSLYNEVFLHTDKAVYDRNRIYGAMGWQLHRDIRLEVGMMSQIQETKSRGQWQIALFNNLPLDR